ncbi:MAG: ABC transporter permease [Alphaproteobacteria bacterium]|nr:ABC transporter permease [Alphaproteobacteria bacterium]
MKNKIMTFIPGALFLLFWQLAVHNNEGAKFLFSSPVDIMRVFGMEILTKNLWINAWATFEVVILGLAIGSILGTVFGLLMWASPAVKRISQPYIAIISAIPIFAIAPMLIIWFGTGLLSKVVMAAFAVFLIALTQAFEGAKTAAKDYMFFANTIKASNVGIVRKIIVPASVQWVLVGFKMNVGFAILGAFIAEFISSKAGLGYYILRSSSTFDVPRVMVGIIMITLLAVAMNYVIGFIERRFMPWARK